MNHRIEEYEKRIDFVKGKLEELKSINNRYSILRLVTFAILLSIVSLCIKFEVMIIALAAFIIFLIVIRFLVIKQLEFAKQIHYFTTLQALNENEIANINFHSNIYFNGYFFENDKHFYSSDLDIFGPASLFHFINRTSTFKGANNLAGWLSAPADKRTIESRQRAVEELAQNVEWNIDFQAALFSSGDPEGNNIKNLLSYLQRPFSMVIKQWIKNYIRIAPFIFLAIFIFICFKDEFWYLPIILAFINLRIVSSFALLIKEIDYLADKIGSTMLKYTEAFANIENRKWQSDHLIQSTGFLLNNLMSVKIKDLSKLIDKLNYRLNLVVAFTLNGIFLWDLRQIIAIEDWKVLNSPKIEKAFELIGEIEAIVSLSTLKYNHEEFVFPQISSSDAYTLNCKKIGHPLLLKQSRITNDFNLNNDHKIDIITGSNMAGKSTFLRTLGINTILAFSGAPVCASYMEVTPFTVFTYMRIKDSLQESTSTFKAELDRLQLLLTTVDGVDKVYFLVDEILRGTNSVDKYLGSKAVIKALIKKQSVGMIATHDLKLADLEKEYPDYIRNHYFDIEVINGEMLFDYKLKEGECKTFNASLLLKQIGINTES